jgi:hypothetical protein
MLQGTGHANDTMDKYIDRINLIKTYYIHNEYLDAIAPGRCTPTPPITMPSSIQDLLD